MRESGLRRLIGFGGFGFRGFRAWGAVMSLLNDWTMLLTVAVVTMVTINVDIQSL